MDIGPRPSDEGTPVLPHAPRTTREPDRFVDGDVDGAVFERLSAHRDERGWLIELFRDDEVLPPQRPAMAYVSETLPGVTRGPHEHEDQTDYFAFIGPGDFTVYLWDCRPESPTYGHAMQRGVGVSNPSRVIIPPGVVHAYRNISDVPGWVFNAPNRLYAGEGKRGEVDEIRHENRPTSPFVME
jgi:dTDP-4-dehydrorhamnose 3,5-epimerase